MTTDTSKGFTVITADEGMRLTNKDKSVIASSVALAVNDDASNWTEITQDEADEIQAAWEAENEDNEDIVENEDNEDIVDGGQDNTND